MVEWSRSPLGRNVPRGRDPLRTPSIPLLQTLFPNCGHSSCISDTISSLRTPSIPLLRTLALYFENFDLLRTPFFHPRHHSYLYRRGSRTFFLYITDTDTHFGDTVPCYDCSHFQSIAGPLHILVNNIIANMQYK